MRPFHCRKVCAFVVLVIVSGGCSDYRKPIPELTKALSNDNAKARRAAARSLGQFGADAEEAVPAFTEKLKDPDPKGRRLSAPAPCRGRPGANDAVPAFIPILKDKNPTLPP